MQFILVYFLIIQIILPAPFKIKGKLEPASLNFIVSESLKFAVLENDTLQVNEGYSAFGFDRDDTGNKILKMRFSDGSAAIKKIILPKKSYKIQKINNLNSDFVTPSNSLTERLEKERNITKQARSLIGKIDTSLFSNGFIRPVEGGRVTGVFGSQRILNGKPRNIHNGFDIASPTGTPVYAMTDGIVRLNADNFFYSGNFVLLDHGQGISSVYLHLSKSLVKEGDFVKKGDKIGEIGTTGRSTGPHLHWGVQWYDKRIDPISILIPEIMELK